MSKTILLFGAGKSATCLIDYLLRECTFNNWQLLVVDNNLELAQSKIGNAAHARALAVNVESAADRKRLLLSVDVVISLLPPSLHILVAKDCVELGRHLLTASYVDEQMKSLADAAKAKGLLFLCEMGLDPGIDHMSAMQLIHRIKAEGGTITSFKSHCGGLVAPESDNNPWHYKISWNPRNVVLAGKSGAIYKEDGVIKQLPYEQLFVQNKRIHCLGLQGYLSWYYNRDSKPYMSLYQLEDTATFFRTTLRYQQFLYGWNHLVALKLTDETPQYDTDGMTLQAFFKQHFASNGYDGWYRQNVTEWYAKAKEMGDKLAMFNMLQEDADEDDLDEVKELNMVTQEGDIVNMQTETIKAQVAQLIESYTYAADLVMKQLEYLGINDAATVINKGLCSAADVLQFAMEKNLALQPADKDMVVMKHEIVYLNEGKEYELSSELFVTGQDATRTAMAKTVGLPLGIAAKLLLQGKLQETGLHIPIKAAIYEPVLDELRQQGISFHETLAWDPDDDEA